MHAYACNKTSNYTYINNAYKCIVCYVTLFLFIEWKFLFSVAKMTADFDKDSTHCLVCNSKVGVSTRNSVRIFNDSSVTTSEKPLVNIIATVLEIDVNEESVHSLVICKKCYKLFNEVK